MYLFGSNNFLWVVLEDKVLFLRASGERDLNALMFPKLQIGGLMLNIDWELIPDVSTKYMRKHSGVIFFCLLTSGIF